MKPVSDLWRPLAAIFLVGSVGAAGGWALAAWDAPPRQGSGGGDDGPVSTLVAYVEQTASFATEVRDFPLSGRIDLPPVTVPLDNITMVSVTLRVSMQGASANDNIHADVRAPDGETRGGDAPQQVRPGGYDISVPIIERWERGARPANEHYPTADEAEAYRWSIENRTDPSSAGDWTGVITVTPPVLPPRTGNASLLFTFTYFVADAFAPLDDEVRPASSPTRALIAAPTTRPSTPLPERS